jgi:antitoxin MazE
MDAVVRAPYVSRSSIRGRLAVRVQVKRCGNSASIRIPTSVMATAALRIDQEVDIRADDGRIVIEPVAGPSYDLDTLLAGMTPETFPDEIDFGRAVGREAW